MKLFNGLLNGLSRLSKTRFNYWAEFALDIPLGLILIFAGMQGGDLNPGEGLLTVAAGLLVFSFLEYSVHRWLFHGSVQMIVESHRAHHKNPLGYDATPFFMPVLILLTLTGLSVMLVPTRYAYLFNGSIALGYVTYGLSHFMIHHHRFHPAFARNWAANHQVHHYHPDTNFGVTTPLWDILLGTRYLYERKRN